MGRTDDLEFSGIKVSYPKFVSENIKIGIWWACMSLIFEVYVAKFQAEVKEANYKIVKDLIAAKLNESSE